MTEQNSTQVFHDRAKQAGDQLRTYIVSISAAATGMLFVNLTDGSQSLTAHQKAAVATAVVMFSVTVMLSLFELHLNARRYYEVAKQQERENPDWSRNESLKVTRLRIILCSYGTMTIGIVATLTYMLMRI